MLYLEETWIRLVEDLQAEETVSGMLWKVGGVVLVRLMGEGPWEPSRWILVTPALPTHQEQQS